MQRLTVEPMKKSYFPLIALMCAFLFSCEPSLEDKIKTKVAESEGVETVSKFEITDTVSVSRLEEMKQVLEESMAMFGQLNDSLPVQIARTKERIANAETKVETEAKFLQPFWQDIIVSEIQNLKKLEELEEKTKMNSDKIEEKMNFIHQALANTQDSVAFYITTFTIDGKEKSCSISPNLTVLSNELVSLEKELRKE